MNRIPKWSFTPISALKQRLQVDLPYLLIMTGVFLAVVLINFPLSGEWLTGWDNLHPEFNFGLNLKRAVFSVWQENQGLGLVGGHGYAATIPHTLFLWLLSFLFPQHLLRAIFTFLMLYSGTIGTYALTRYILAFIHKNHHGNSMQMASCVSALYVMLNLGTVQNFYIQLEAFIVHFAFLPWLMLSFWMYLQNPSPKRLFFWIIVNIAIIPAGFIPPLSFVQLLLIAIHSVVWVIHKMSIQKFKTLLIAGFSLICIHAFWLFPFIYYTATHSHIYLNAYNNQQSTQDFILKNRLYGSLKDVSLIKGFLFDAQDVTPKGNLVFLFESWKNHINQWYVSFIGMSFFTLGALGCIRLLWQKPHQSEKVSLALSAIIVFTFLATDVPLFSSVTQFLQANIPLFFQAFRISFTKFSLAYGLLLSVLIGVGLEWLFGYMKKMRAISLTTVFILVTIGIYTAPTFLGNFLYTRTKVAIPVEYLSLFEFFEDRPQGERILHLPVGWNWGWTIHKWGYTGSGFLWYGIQQSIVDRSFDVWSNMNENLYWELNLALYSKNYIRFESLLDKYQIDWLFFDPSVLAYPGGLQRIFAIDNVQEYLKSSQKISKEYVFGNLKLYKVKSRIDIRNGIILADDVPNVLPAYKWTDNDVAADRFLLYTNQTNLPPDAYIPFRSLFTGRNITEKEFDITRSASGLLFSSIASFKNLSATNLPIHTSMSPTGIVSYFIPNEKLNIISDSSTDPNFYDHFVNDCSNVSNTKQKIIETEGKKAIVFDEKIGKQCFDIILSNVWHGSGYLLEIESANKEGKSLQLALVNHTTQRTDYEVSLLQEPDLKTSYFILPPAMPDGLGYSIKFTNISFGKYSAVNYLSRVILTEIPYETIAQINLFSDPSTSTIRQIPINSIEHSNSSLYQVSIPTNSITDSTLLVLSQAFDKDWVAYDISSCGGIKKWFCQSFPNVLGKSLKTHVLVNNWANGWALDEKTLRQKDNKTSNGLTVLPSDRLTIILFFWPQLLQWLGFLLLPIPFLFALWPKKHF